MNLIPDIRTVFAYHGAEHKTINAYEHHAPMEPEPVAKYSTAHVRCGTSFLFAVMIIAILVFSLVPSSNIWVRIASRIVLLPVIAGVGYEFTRFSARFAENRDSAHSVPAGAGFAEADHQATEQRSARGSDFGPQGGHRG